MKYLKFLCSFFAVVFSISLMGQDAEKTDDPNSLFFHSDSLISQLKSEDKRWTPFINGSNVLTGLYHLKVGTEDKQQPHDTDEVYYIIDGKAKFVVDGKQTEISKGSILFVKAEVSHRFMDIEEELVVLVFFDK